MFRSPEARATIEAWYDRFLARVPAPTERRTVPTRLGDTHVLVAGPADAPPLVLLHGAMASAAHALGEVGPLIGRLRIHAVDVIGQSVKSAEPRRPPDGRAYGAWLAEVLDGLGLARAHVYGVSFGGLVALHAASVAPARIDRLVLLVPAGVVAGSPWAQLTKVGIPLLVYRAFPSEASLARFTRAQLTTPDPDWSAYLGDAVRCYGMPMRYPPLLSPEALAGFDRPTLVLGASDDVHFPGPKLLARAKALIPHAEVELLPGCRHAPPTEDAFRRALADRVGRFLGAPPEAEADGRRAGG
jgi:pimeloyl-ACP methyl ester carboxylesterase